MARVDPRFVSYNIEAVEITGGRFWKPYSDEVRQRLAASVSQGPGKANGLAGLDQNLFQYRPPINLANSKLRNLSAALGPAYIRVSGTWRNTTYFQDDDAPALQQPPAGYKGVMTRAQWKGVVDFARATGGAIVTSVAIGDGARNTDGSWNPESARGLFEYTRHIGGHIAAAEFMNEPTYYLAGGAPRGYSAKTFATDVRTFRAFLKEASPQTIFLGPGSVGEGVEMTPANAPKQPVLRAEDLLQASGPVFDVFSYHFYGTISHRCAAMLGPAAGTTLEQALTSDWFARNTAVEEFYAKLRDTYLPGKELWLTETGQSGCGGDAWAATFADSFRYLDQLGTLAQRGVKTVMHNTLASSDYGLLDEETFDPRPNYWAALLWTRSMGTTALSPGVKETGDLHLFAHCAKGNQGGVTLLVLNTSASTVDTLRLPVAGEVYTLTATELQSRNVMLNGVELRANADGTLPALTAKKTAAGQVQFAPRSISFLLLPTVHNKNCMRQ